MCSFQKAWSYLGPKSYPPGSYIYPILSRAPGLRSSKVELVDSGLDDVASEALLGVLMGKAGTIRRLNLAQNRLGVKGATVLARYIAHKG